QHSGPYEGNIDRGLRARRDDRIRPSALARRWPARVLVPRATRRLHAEPANAVGAHVTATAKLTLDVALQRDGFDLAIQRTLELRGITALFGPSGAGKTTLLRVIAGLEDSVRGALQFDETVWQRGKLRVPAHQRAIGYVFQDGRLFAHLDVAENLR